MTSRWSEGVHVIIERVVARTGWELPPTRWLNAEALIGQAMRRADLSHVDDFVKLLDSDEQVLESLIEGLLIYETYFFRDPQHFQLIRERWSKEMQGRHGDHHVYRLWSAGCASGEEPYSLAIVLRELGWAPRTRIKASDLSRLALSRARQGTYTRWALRESDSTFISTYFQTTEDGRFQLDESIRSMVTFDHLNLSRGGYPAPMPGTDGFDLILCRNVAIYLSQSTLQNLGRWMFSALAAGGWLILGPSDPLLNQYAPFELCEMDGILVHKRPAAVSVRSLPSYRPLPSPDPPSFARPAPAPAPAPAESSAEEPDERIQLRRHIKALADSNQFDEAERAIVAARARHPVASDFLFLHMIILLGLDRHAEAAKIAEELIHLDRELAIAHFFRGSSLRAIGDIEGARHSFENALRICAERPTHEPVAFSEGENHVRLGQAAASQLKQLSRRDAAKQKVGGE